MNDQASTLRNMSSTEKNADSATKKKSGSSKVKKENGACCIAVTSGKGGVGKSTLAVNIALQLGVLGSQVLLLDADFGLANADVLCGVTPRYHLGHVITGAKKLTEISIPLSEQVALLPGGSGIEELANLSKAKHAQLFKELEEIENNHDFMIIDTGAGIAQNVLDVLAAAPRIIVVLTPEPTSIIDAYSTIKVVLQHSPKKQISVIVNDSIGVGGAEQAFLQIRSAVLGFLKCKVELLGVIPQDSQIPRAICEQTPITQLAPTSPASRAIRFVAKNLHGQTQKDSPFKTRSFWGNLGDR